MPCFLPLRKSTQHRVAVIALYKALLSQCAVSALPDSERTLLRNAIQNKFRRNKKIQSPYQLRLSFKAGYETLDVLDASISGDDVSTNELLHTISILPPGLSRPLSTKHARSIKSGEEERRLECLPPERAVLNVRPYARTSGPRHVPVLVNANGVPFLRLTKPQPASLTRVLHQRLRKKDKLLEVRVLLDQWYMPACQQEDKWDLWIEEQLGIQSEDVKWVDAVDQVKRENKAQYYEEQMKDKKLARKMQGIVDRETELAVKEGQTIIRGRKRRPLSIIKPSARQV